MGLFGRENGREAERAQRIGAWVQQRTSLSLCSAMFGCLAVLEAWTMVLGVAAGLAAVGTGLAGLRELRDTPERYGWRLCRFGIVMGCVGLTLSVSVWLWLKSLS
jgi:hypothetical protein